MQIEAQLRKIQAGPQGASIGAFFDFDGTLIDGFSASEYFKQGLRKREIRSSELLAGLKASFTKEMDETRFTELFEELLSAWVGRTEEELRELWRQLFLEKIARLMFHEGYRLVQAHLQAGHTVVIASSATRYQIEPLADEYGIDHILASELDIQRDIFNGKFKTTPLWASHKANAVRTFARKNKIALSKSYAYANGDEDIEFLSLTGHPCAVNAQKELAKKAESAGWASMAFQRRRSAPLKAVVGTIGAYTAMTGTMLAGMAYNRLYDQPRRAADMIGTIGSELGFAIAGIKVNIINEHNLWRVRPAVFILNHQSKLDFFLFYNIIRRDLTGVVKKEAEQVPVIGPFLRMAEMSFLDRSNTRRAIDALQPAVDRLRRGLSVAISPEGTRSYTPKLGRFKKGAFHIARQAGVPIVPVVIRNAGELMWREDHAMRSGTVDVCVLDPIDVCSWSEADMDKNIEEVRQLFVNVLEHWPDQAIGTEVSL